VEKWRRPVLVYHPVSVCAGQYIDDRFSSAPNAWQRKRAYSQTANVDIDGRVFKHTDENESKRQQTGFTG
jgi:hypothetical protein